MKITMMMKRIKTTNNLKYNKKNQRNNIDSNEDRRNTKKSSREFHLRGRNKRYYQERKHKQSIGKIKIDHQIIKREQDSKQY